MKAQLCQTKDNHCTISDNMCPLVVPFKNTNYCNLKLLFVSVVTCWFAFITDDFSVEIANSATFVSETLPLFKKHEMQVIVERAHQLQKHLSRHVKSLDSD